MSSFEESRQIFNKSLENKPIVVVNNNQWFWLVLSNPLFLFASGLFDNLSKSAFTAFKTYKSNSYGGEDGVSNIIQYTKVSGTSNLIGVILSIIQLIIKYFLIASLYNFVLTLINYSLYAISDYTLPFYVSTLPTIFMVNSAFMLITLIIIACMGVFAVPFIFIFTLNYFQVYMDAEYIIQFSIFALAFMSWEMFLKKIILGSFLKYILIFASGVSSIICLLHDGEKYNISATWGINVLYIAPIVGTFYIVQHYFSSQSWAKEIAFIKNFFLPEPLLELKKLEFNGFMGFKSIAFMDQKKMHFAKTSNKPFSLFENGEELIETANVAGIVFLFLITLIFSINTLSNNIKHFKWTNPNEHVVNVEQLKANIYEKCEKNKALNKLDQIFNASLTGLEMNYVNGFRTNKSELLLLCEVSLSKQEFRKLKTDQIYIEIMEGSFSSNRGYLSLVYKTNKQDRLMVYRYFMKAEGLTDTYEKKENKKMDAFLLQLNKIIEKKKREKEQREQEKKNER